MSRTGEKDRRWQSLAEWVEAVAMYWCRQKDPHKCVHPEPVKQARERLEKLFRQRRLKKIKNVPFAWGEDTSRRKTLLEEASFVLGGPAAEAMEDLEMDLGPATDSEEEQEAKEEKDKYAGDIRPFLHRKEA